MTREDFLEKLSEKIIFLPTVEKNKAYEFYNEIILDKKECGMEEEEIIAGFGDIDEIAARIITEYQEETAALPPRIGYRQNNGVSSPVSQPLPPKRSTGATVLLVTALVLGSPIWLSLLIALFTVILSVVICIFALILSFWAVTAALVLSGVAGAGLSFLVLPQSPWLTVLELGLSLFLVGLGILLIPAMIKLTELSARFTAWIFRKAGLIFRRRKTMVQEGGSNG